MSETNEMGSIKAVEATLVHQELLPKAQLEQRIEATMNEIVAKNANPNPEKNPVGIFTPSWEQQDRFKNLPREQLELLGERREQITGAVLAGEQVGKKLPHAQLALDSDNIFHYVRVEDDGSQKTGQVPLEHFIFACEEIAVQTQDADLKEKAEAGAEVLKNHFEVTLPGGKPMLYAEYEIKRTAKAQELAQAAGQDYSQLAEGQKLAYKLQADKALQPEFQLVKAPEPAPAPAEAAPEAEKAKEVEKETRAERDYKYLASALAFPEEAKVEILPLIEKSHNQETSEEELKTTLQALNEKITQYTDKADWLTRTMADQQTREMYKFITGGREIPPKISLEQMREDITNYIVRNIPPEQRKDFKSFLQILREKKPSQESLLIFFMVIMGFTEFAKSVQAQAGDKV